MFKKYKYDIDLVSEPYENLRFRDRTVLILCKDSDGKYILGAKSDFYPKNIVRMIGGGVDKDEEVIDGALREVKEEIGVVASLDEMVEIVQIDVTGVFRDKIYKNQISVYFLKSKKDDYLAGDDVSEIARYSEEDYRNLVKRFFDLKPNNFYDKNGLSFSWGDFGKVYGFVHKVTLEELLLKNI